MLVINYQELIRIVLNWGFNLQALSPGRLYMTQNNLLFANYFGQYIPTWSFVCFGKLLHRGYTRAKPVQGAFDLRISQPAGWQGFQI